VIASTTAIIAQTLLLAWALVRRLPQMHFAPLLPSFLKVLLGTVVMAVVVGAGWFGVQSLRFGGTTSALIAVLGLIPAGVAVYGLVLWKLEIEGRDEIGAMLARMPLAGRFFRPAL
jgi:hypothetical protein